jgi:hypothetical protein
MLPADERHIKATLARQIVERNDLNVWLSRQINDINYLLARILPETTNRTESDLSLATANVG